MELLDHNMMDFEFYKPEEKIFGETVQEYVKEEVEKQGKAVILSGFPYDEGTRINGGRIGGSVASTIFRKTLKEYHIYPHHQLSVYDTGDIER